MKIFNLYFQLNSSIVRFIHGKNAQAHPIYGILFLSGAIAASFVGPDYGPYVQASDFLPFFSVLLITSIAMRALVKNEG